ncbi:helix-turn-helix transcriptional regulator [Pelagibius litoralis]|uniref:Helix-turn-helix transcriptional regulator n=1 Tax=Pelagibius litoralis TaxID=374515 RepID=A0A967C3L1_9PROT|nr:helix-turn-helix transcriptional regulator [Pelagibius litoralis]NIA67915.1 helix-turn-helix transcriptional regulator [Pelagibius litoralis]
MLTGPQVRAARGLIGMKQTELAEASGVSTPTVKAVEAQKGTVSAHTRTADAIQRALEAAGVVFLPENGNGPGVALRKD